MAIKLPELPYGYNELEPYISKETLKFHHDKHHKAYVDKLNKLIAKTPYEKMELEDIILESTNKEGADKKIFNNAAQTWNHTFLWNSMIGEGRKKPSKDFNTIIEGSFGSFKEFQDKFKETAADLFGSGWAWLVKDTNDKLAIRPLKDAENPLAKGELALLACDVWEHAYYLDYQNERPKYLDNFFKVINWDFVEANFEKSSTSLRKPAELIQKPEGHSANH